MAPVFSWRSFGLSALAVIGAPVAAALGHVFLSDRLGLPAGTASGLALAAGVAWAVLGGAAAAVAGRRIAFYEIVAATILLLALALGPLVLVLPALRGLPLVLHSWQYQGRVVLTAGLLLVCLSAGALAFLGSTLAFLLTGSGRFDPSMGWELFVARSHLKLHARTLGALFLIVVTGVIPGLLAGIAWSAWQDHKARRAAISGEPHERPRLPATMLMTLISIGGVATGVWALTVVLSVMSGFEQDLKSKILGAHAHGVVLKYGQNDFTDWRGTQERVLSVPGVAASTPFLYAEVMLSAGQNLTGSILKGVDTATLGKVTEIPRSLEEGKLEWLDRPEEIPPAKPRLGLSEALEGTAGEPAAGGPAGRRPRREAAGDPARPRAGARTARRGRATWSAWSPRSATSGRPGPQPKSRPFRVAGLLYSGFYEYDAKFAYIQLAEAQRFFGTGDSVTGLELKVNDVNAARPGDAQGAGRARGLPLPHQGLGGDEPEPLLGAHDGADRHGGDPGLHHAGGELHRGGHAGHAGAGEDPRDRRPPLHGRHHHQHHEDLRGGGAGHRGGRDRIRAPARPGDHGAGRPGRHPARSGGLLHQPPAGAGGRRATSRWWRSRRWRSPTWPPSTRPPAPPGSSRSRGLRGE